MANADSMSPMFAAGDAEFSQWLTAEITAFRQRPMPLFKAALAKNLLAGGSSLASPHRVGSEQMDRPLLSLSQTSQ